MSNKVQPDKLTMNYMDELRSIYPELTDEEIANTAASHLAQPLFQETVERVKELEGIIEAETGEPERSWFSWSRKSKSR